MFGNEVKIGNILLKEEPVIMGILNVTPDSFSDGGRFNEVDAALKHTEEMIRDGAAIIDIGGESTRPGYDFVSSQEEIERTAPVIEAIKNKFDVAVSLDTYKTPVAAAGIEAGADLINDIWGLKVSQVLAKEHPEYALENSSEAGFPTYANAKLAKLVAEKKVPICLMHNRDCAEYEDYMPDVLKDLQESVDIAHLAGIQDSQLILDPGVGFGKTFQNNLEIIKKVDALQQWQYPILLGTSRKSVIGLALDVDKDERLAGTIATTVMGVERGCKIFRVHDVKENYQAMKMTLEILKA